MTPVLALALLAQAMPVNAGPVQPTKTNPCVAGGNITTTISNDEANVTVNLKCTVQQITSTTSPGGGGTTNYFPVNPPANAGWNSTLRNTWYCAGSTVNGPGSNPTAIYESYWAPVSVKPNGSGAWFIATLGGKQGQWIVTGPLDPPGSYPAAPAGTYYSTRMNPDFIPGNVLAGSTVQGNILGQDYSGVIGTTQVGLSMAVEAKVDAPVGGPAPGDASVDATALKNILAGPVYYKWNLIGAKWVGGKNPIAAIPPVYQDNYGWVKTSSDAPFTTSTIAWTTDVRGDTSGPTYTSPKIKTVRTIVAKTGTSKVVETTTTWYTISSYTYDDRGTRTTTTQTDYTMTQNDNYKWAVVSRTLIKAGVPGVAGVAPKCMDGTWSTEPFIKGVITTLEPDGADIYLWPLGKWNATPATTNMIPSAWSSLANLAASVAPGTMSQKLGQPYIQVVGVPFPYGMNGQSYNGAAKQVVVGPMWTPPNSSGVSYWAEVVATVGLTGVKWDWGDGTQSQFWGTGSLGLGVCSPEPCGPQRTPTHVGNGKVRAWEYYDSDVTIFYYDATIGAEVTKDLGPFGTGANGAYQGCASDPNPAVRPSSNFCLQPNIAAPGSAQLSNGTGGFPYSVGQVEGIPGS